MNAAVLLLLDIGTSVLSSTEYVEKTGLLWNMSTVHHLQDPNQ
jgi:hypothetical protein